MIWCLLIISLGLAAARERVEPEHLMFLRNTGQDEEFARLLGVDVNLVRENNEERSEGSKFNHVSHLGDILLQEDQERQALNEDRYGSFKWPNGRIPIAFAAGDFTNEEIQFIVRSCRDWNSKVRNVKLVDYNGQNDYVIVINGNGCYSYLGRTGGQQVLSLQRNGCISNGTVQHEFMHAAGFTHEHNRADRDQFVEVLWDNIPESWQSQYQKVNEQDFVSVGDYGYDSVMHYPIWAPETYKDAFKILRPGVSRETLGQDIGLSDNDIKKIDQIYSS